MEKILIFWVLKKYGKKRGYKLSPKECKEFIPYSDKVMQKKYEKWVEERIQTEYTKE